MPKKNDVKFTVKNVFKTDCGNIQKREFNIRYEKYINFCEKESLEKDKRHISHLSPDSHTQSIVSSAEKCDL